MGPNGKQYIVALAIYPVTVSILLATLFYCLAHWRPLCGSNNFSASETEETLDALSSLGGFGSLAKQLKDQPRELLFASVVAVISFLISVILITFCLLCLYRYGLTRFIRYWLMLSTTVVLSLTGSTLLVKVFQFLCIPLDWISLWFMMWNFSIGGVVAVFYYAPLWLRHLYLILMSSLLSWLFRDFPSFVVGILLVGLAIWDIYAVLSPRGPLRDMVESVYEHREETEFPSLVYDTCPYDYDCIREVEQMKRDQSAVWNSSPSTVTNQPEEDSVIDTNASRMEEYHTVVVDDGNVGATASFSGTSTNAHIENNWAESEDSTTHESHKYIKVGLGDFVFYCVLVAKSSDSNILTWFFCLCSVLVGFYWTLVLLLGYRKALPALPISICLGLISFWISTFATYPFSNHFASTFLLL